MIKNLLKKVTAEKPKDWHRYLGPLMFAVRDTPQDSTGSQHRLQALCGSSLTYELEY